jgi:uncharacterized membrane protein
MLYYLFVVNTSKYIYQFEITSILFANAGRNTGLLRKAFHWVAFKEFLKDFSRIKNLFYNSLS